MNRHRIRAVTTCSAHVWKLIYCFTLHPANLINWSFRCTLNNTVWNLSELGNASLGKISEKIENRFFSFFHLRFLPLTFPYWRSAHSPVPFQLSIPARRLLDWSVDWALIFDLWSLPHLYIQRIRCRFKPWKGANGGRKFDLLIDLWSPTFSFSLSFIRSPSEIFQWI